MRWLGLVAASTVLVAAPAAAAERIPEREAFKLPSIDRCVNKNKLTLTLREQPWQAVTVTVDGKRVASSTDRRIPLAELPAKRFKLRISGRTTDGRTAVAKRTYHPCAPGRPNTVVPDGAPPSKLVKRDIVRGTGARARSGATLVVHYEGVGWISKKIFDSSWTRGSTFSFPLGAGQVIEGWDQGLVGMRVGGRRELIIPPALAYGDDGVPPEIAPRETITFTVDLIEIRPKG
ncbi:FKBP-type peptidyl-prolyl isomerase-like protein [Solirubrobacter pauli]|uniref:Peptidyl-prolyl cis-trans isomerase n=1 Tax=Solirubrobacter pauli TaxID=166793 RepID=A0A660L594_9ACTN|nr:FKBP-type peptidyl-prolyl cis-trans isomerase [Solirubrobacter pauli]RKQ90272.1 FKBP-type peptidyl-prolyl isomerase-like protein [Solirubrobacter pauli]